MLEVVRVLRDHLTVEGLRERFETGAPEGYRLIGLRADGAWRAAAGFRVYTNFVSGRIIYVDDLVTTSDERSKGYGKAMNDHLMELARSEGCTTLNLDSAVHRHRAHRFYLREGYDISAHHFSQKL